MFLGKIKYTCKASISLSMKGENFTLFREVFQGLHVNMQISDIENNKL